MRALTGIVMAALLAAGCLSATPKTLADDGLPDDSVADPGAGPDGSVDLGAPEDPGPQDDPGTQPDPGADVAGDPGADPAGDPGAPDAADPGGPDCGFQATFESDRDWVAWGEAAQLSWTVTGDAPDLVNVTIDAPFPGNLLQKGVEGSATFLWKQVADASFRTTPVTLRLKADKGDCHVEIPVTVKVLGNVWVTLYTGEVQVWRSDGAHDAAWGWDIAANQHFGTPWCLAELPNGHVAIGNHAPADPSKPVEIFSLAGTWLGSFDTYDPKDVQHYLWSGSGAHALLVHGSEVWVGGPNGVVLVFDTDGHYLREIPLTWGNAAAESLVELPAGEVLVVLGGGTPKPGWDLDLVGTDGKAKGRPSLDAADAQDLAVWHGAMARPGELIFGGESNGDGWLVPMGLDFHSTSSSTFYGGPIPKYGIAGFGDGYLAVVQETGGAGQDSVIMLDGVLKPSATPFMPPLYNGYRGLIVMGGN